VLLELMRSTSYREVANRFWKRMTPDRRTKEPRGVKQRICPFAIALCNVRIAPQSESLLLLADCPFSATADWRSKRCKIRKLLKIKCA
jgi:hypothetical protein